MQCDVEMKQQHCQLRRLDVLLKEIKFNYWERRQRAKNRVYSIFVYGWERALFGYCISRFTKKKVNLSWKKFKLNIGTPFHP